MFRNGSLVGIVYGSLVRLPAPANISYFWNFSSCLGLFLSLQILTGLFLTMHYSSYIEYAFDSVVHICNDVNYSWLLRYLHMNSASFFLGLVYLHTCRSIYYKRYSNMHAWNIGVTMLVLSMLTAFLGYVLPWGQMSFWGATVITNLISAVPVVGGDIVYWVWGGFSVSAPTLSRFYTFHFLFPLVIAVFAVFHLYFIHTSGGSSNPLGFFSSSFKLDFWPFFGVKDVLGFVVILFFYFLVVCFFSNSFADPENYLKANSLVTPVHIKPEWYFLFAYAMLRCIPNKLLGVLALVFSILVFYLLPFSTCDFKLSVFYQCLFWMWSFNFIMLTWLGSCPVKDTFNYLSQVCGIFYFFSLFLMCLV